jgi:hypothetical protein
VLGRRDQQIAAGGPSLGRQGGGLDLSTTRSPQPTQVSCSESLSSSSLLNSRRVAQISIMTFCPYAHFPSAANDVGDAVFHRFSTGLPALIS